MLLQKIKEYFKKHEKPPTPLPTTKEHKPKKTTPTKP